MDQLLAALLSQAIKTGTSIAADKAGGNTKDFEMRPQAGQQQAPQQQKQQQAPQGLGEYGQAFKNLIQRIFGTPPTNINPPATSNMVGPFKPTSMPQDDPYGFGSYY